MILLFMAIHNSICCHHVLFSIFPEQFNCSKQLILSQPPFPEPVQYICNAFLTYTDICWCPIFYLNCQSKGCQKDFKITKEIAPNSTERFLGMSWEWPEWVTSSGFTPGRAWNCPPGISGEPFTREKLNYVTVTNSPDVSEQNSRNKEGVWDAQGKEKEMFLLGYSFERFDNCCNSHKYLFSTWDLIQNMCLSDLTLATVLKVSIKYEILKLNKCKSSFLNDLLTLLLEAKMYINLEHGFGLFC